MKTAIITGARGQDGAYLARALLSKGYRVYATHRRSSSSDLWRMRFLGILGMDDLHILEQDIVDVGSAVRLIERCRPHEIYNLAAQSFVTASFEQPMTTASVNCLGTLSLLESIRTVDRTIRFYQASSSEMFGKIQAMPQNEQTPFYPRSPYGVSKLFGHWMTVNYRESYDLFACSGILFNHESPVRGSEFVTRRISEAVARIKHGDRRPLRLGNLSARRDWGFAGDYVEGMWRMLQAEAPDSYVLATGRTETVRDFATMAFRAAGLDLHWRGEGQSETASLRRGGTPIVEVDASLYRPAEVDLLVGDSSKARERLGWTSATSLEALCTMMVEADLDRVRPMRQARPRPSRNAVPDLPKADGRLDQAVARERLLDANV